MLTINATFILSTISFLIFLFIIKSILYRPITKVINERENFYNKNSKMTSESKEKSDALLEEKEAKIKNAKIQASELIKEASQVANKESAQKIKETKLMLQEQIEASKNELIQESENAKKEIKHQMNDIVSQIVSKMLCEKVEINLDEEKINRYLKI